jgi:hypothetical protein
MRTILRTILTAGLLASGFAGADALAQSYPRSVCNGMDCTIDYGPMGQGNLVGGGRVNISMTDGMTTSIIHLDSMFAQQPREGFVPLSIGSGENSETIWVPAMMRDMIRRARQSMPAAAR